MKGETRKLNIKEIYGPLDEVHVVINRNMFMFLFLASLKSTSVKKACRKSIRDQKFGVGAIFKKLVYETFDIKKIMGL